jgi:nitrate reductase NapE component
MALPPDISFADSLKRDQRRAFYEAHKDIALVMILVVFLFPIVGVNASGLLGAVWGVVISILAYYLMPYVTLKLGA